MSGWVFKFTGLYQRMCDFSNITYFHPKPIIIHTWNDHIKSSERWQVLTLSYVRSLVHQRHVAGSNCRSQIHFTVLAVLPIPMLCQFNRSFVLVGSQMDHKTTIIAYTNAIWPLRTGSDYVIEGHAVHFAHPNYGLGGAGMRQINTSNLGLDVYWSFSESRVMRSTRVGSQLKTPAHYERGY